MLVIMVYIKASFVDSKSLYGIVLGIISTMEKRLLIYLALLKQAYEHWEIAEIMWIPPKENFSYALTKRAKNMSPSLP